MRKFLVLLVVPAFLGCKGGAGGGSSSAPVELKDEDQKTLYALGLILGRNIARDFNPKPEELALIQAGIADQVKGNKPKVELDAYGPKVGQMARSRQGAKSDAEKAKSKAFEEQMAKEPKAEKTASGLIYIPLKEGSGASPTAADTVKVHYEGKLTNGEVFDSSRQRGEPTEFPLGGVVPCWTEGLQKMKVGGTAKLICPSPIAYGDRGSPPKIPGGATLQFEVELIGITPKGAQGQPPAAPKSDPHGH